MDTMLPLLVCLIPEVRMTTLHRLAPIVRAMLAMTGRITMRGLSRWAGTGGSYRTIQRFFHTTLPWAAILWCFVRTHLLTPGEDVLLIGDAWVTTKAGMETYGVDRVFSSIAGKPVPGVALFALALVSRRDRQAFPVAREQVEREPVTALPRSRLPPSGSQGVRRAAARRPRPMRR